MPGIYRFPQFRPRAIGTRRAVDGAAGWTHTSSAIGVATSLLAHAAVLGGLLAAGWLGWLQPRIPIPAGRNAVRLPLVVANPRQAARPVRVAKAPAPMADSPPASRAGRGDWLGDGQRRIELSRAGRLRAAGGWDGGQDADLPARHRQWRPDRRETEDRPEMNRPPGQDRSPAKTAAPAQPVSARPDAGSPDPLLPAVKYRPSFPPYPPDAWARHQQGVVQLMVMVNETGRVVQVRLLRSSGVDSLDRAARQWAADIVFQIPRGGWSVTRHSFRVPVRFTIDDG